MRVAVSRLLDGAIDYAGLFPPARLEMAEAIDRFGKANEGREAWIVARFVCGAARLDALADAIEARPHLAYVPVSVVGSASADRASWETALEEDAQRMNAFDRRLGDRAAVEAFEMRVPSHTGFEGYLRDLRGFSEAEVYVELPWGEGMRDSMAILAESEWASAKARTGGLTKDAVPSAGELAQFVRECVDLELSFKLTAGLHHALPTWDASIDATTHGFLNVFAATAFALTEEMSSREIETLLGDADPTAWEFGDRDIAWRGKRFGFGEIDQVRDLFVSFGSCSIDEPLADIAALQSGT